jgi:hypothetical protein
VAFDEKSWLEEENESSFGKVLGIVVETKGRPKRDGKAKTVHTETKKTRSKSMVVSGSGGPANNNQNKNTGNTVSKKNQKGGSSTTTTITARTTETLSKSVESKNVGSDGVKKRKVLAEEGSDGEESLSTGSAKKRSQDREARRKRRQAIVEEEMEKKFMAHKKQQASAGGALMGTGKDDNQPHVTRVELLTGTLLLFRGTHPRAEFIRRK